LTSAAYSDPERDAPGLDLGSEPLSGRLAHFPWWFVALILVCVLFAGVILTDPDYQDAFLFIINGIVLTILISIGAYLVAIVLGLLAGLGRVSANVIASNVATFYIEFIRGIPMLVLIFFIALVAVPAAVGALHTLGVALDNAGLPNPLTGLQNENVSLLVRAVIALATTYGAFLAEIFRAGIQSVGEGQMEAARSLGMSYSQAMWYVILPQAVRNVLPALGNDFVAMVKDSSLVSVLAVRDITQIARLYAGRSFRFPEAYTTLSILYLSMTIVLSLAIRILERRLRSHA
jgi:polar amino acid transport system permease protein